MSFYLRLCKDFMLIDLLGRSGGALFLPALQSIGTVEWRGLPV